MLQSNKTRRNTWLCSLAYMVRIVNVLNNIYFSSNQERWLYLRPRQRLMFILSPPWVRRSTSRVKYVCSRYEYLLDHICRERTRLCVFRVHLGLWPHFLFLHAKTIWINTGRRSICIARYPKRQSVLGLFLACFFFFCLLLQKIHICCANALIYFSQQMDLTRMRRVQFLHSYIRKPHTRSLARRARCADENRFEHTVLSFELICMTLSAKAEPVPDSGGAGEQETIMLCLLNTAALCLTSRCLFLAFVFTSTRSRLKP